MVAAHLMPELPEVETTRRGLAPVFTGSAIRRVRLAGPGLRAPFTPGLARQLRARRCRRLARRGKYLLAHLDDRAVLLMHMGMSGRFVIHPPGAPRPAARHDHVRFDFAAGAQVVYHDPRRFGLIERIPRGALAGHPRLAHLGPDALDPALTTRQLAAAFAGRQAAVKTLLLDQRIVAGIGNIYASEALFAARLSPFLPAGQIGPAGRAGLLRAVRAVLRAALASGGASLRDFRRADGQPGHFQHRFKVYDRAGKPCPRRTCRAPLARAVQTGRASFFCPRCQPLPPRPAPG